MYIIRAMKTLDRLHILYDHAREKRYQYIAAISEEELFSIQFYVGISEATTLRERPFDLGVPDLILVPCATKSEAIIKADNEHSLSLSDGWRDYRAE
jgi:hypothetical protein